MTATPLPLPPPLAHQQKEGKEHTGQGWPRLGIGKMDLENLSQTGAGDIGFVVALVLAVLSVGHSADRQADVFFLVSVVWAIAAAAGAVWIQRQRNAKAAAQPRTPKKKAATTTTTTTTTAATEPSKKSKKQDDTKSKKGANGKVTFDNAKVKKVCPSTLPPSLLFFPQDLDKDLAEWEKKLVKITSERDTVVADLERVLRKHDEAKTRLLKEKDTVEQKTRAAKADVARIKEESGGVSTLHSEVQRRVREEARVVDEELRQIADQSANIERDAEAARNVCRVEERKVKHSQKQAESVLKRHREVEDSLQRLTEEVDDYDEQISTLNEENSQLREELQALLPDERTVDEWLEDYHARRRAKKGGKNGNEKGGKGNNAKKGAKGAKTEKNNGKGGTGKRRPQNDKQEDKAVDETPLAEDTTAEDGAW